MKSWVGRTCEVHEPRTLEEAGEISLPAMSASLAIPDMDMPFEILIGPLALHMHASRVVNEIGCVLMDIFLRAQSPFV